MSNNTSLQQYKSDKLAELKALTDRIEDYFDEYTNPDPEGGFFYINTIRKDVNGWVKPNMDKLCHSKQDVDVLFNWKEAYYQNILLKFRKKELEKFRTLKYNPGRGEYVKSAKQQQENNNLAANDKKYSKANVTKLHQLFRDLQNREHERVQKERKAARNSKKARNSSRSGVSTSNRGVSTLNRAKSIRNATASAAARSSGKPFQTGRFSVTPQAFGRKIRRRGTKRRQAKRGRRGSKKKGRSRK